MSNYTYTNHHEQPPTGWDVFSRVFPEHPASHEKLSHALVRLKRKDGALLDLLHQHPRKIDSARKIRAVRTCLREQIYDLLGDLDDLDWPTAELLVTSALEEERVLEAAESDLVFESYWRDLGVGD